MGKVAKFTIDEVAMSLAIVAGVNPDVYADPEVVAFIYKVKAMYSMDYEELKVVYK